MKSNKKTETLILIGLAIVALAYVFFRFMLTPLLNKEKELETQLGNADLMLRNMNEIVLSHDTCVDDLNAVCDDAEEKLSTAFVQAGNDEYLAYLRDLMEQSGITLVSFSSKGEEDFQNPEVLQDSESEDGTDEQSATDSEEETGVIQVKESVLNIEASGSYDQIYSFLSLLKTSEKNTICESLSIEKPVGSSYYTADGETSSSDTGDRFLGSEELTLKMEFRMINIASSATDVKGNYEKDNSVTQLVPQDFLDGSYREFLGFIKY